MSYLARTSNICLCTYPKWAIGHIGSSPDNRNSMFDGFDRHVRTGKHTIRLALHLDIDGVSFAILKSSKTRSGSGPSEMSVQFEQPKTAPKCIWVFFFPELQLKY